MNQPHHERDHATWSASATARNVTCAGAIAMSTMAGPDKETIHSARGTACHEVAERCLRNTQDAIDFLGETVKTKEHEIEIDMEVVDGAQMYVDYVKGLSVHPKVQTWIEQKFSLDDLKGPFEAGGTCDAVVYEPYEKLLEVADLKFGMGVVEANENPQLRTYALGAMLKYADLDVERIKVTIVQPRASHKEGRIRSETFHVADLVDWTANLVKSMLKAKEALDAFEIAKGNSLLLDAWTEAWLRAGACKFCPAEGFCPARRKDALKIVARSAQQWFEAPSDEPLKIENVPAMQSPEALAHCLDGLDALEAWISAIRGHAHAEAERGVTIPGYQLADKIGLRAWKDEAAAIAALGKLIDADKLYTRKLVSPAQADKLLGKKKSEIENLWEKPLRGTNLVSTAKTERAPARNKAEAFFEAVKEN